MSNKFHYTSEEWDAISAAPAAAGLLITLSDARGHLRMGKALAVAKAIKASARGDAPEIVKVLAESVTTVGGRLTLPDVPRGDPGQTHAALIATVSAAVAAVERRSPAEVEGYKAWLASVTAKVSHAAMERRALAIGGTRMSRDEEHVLKQLAGVLGVGARAAGPIVPLPHRAERGGASAAVSPTRTSMLR